MNDLYKHHPRSTHLQWSRTWADHVCRCVTSPIDVATSFVFLHSPVLALSCINNITRLQLILPIAMADTRTVVGISDEQDRPLLDQQWRIIGGGYIVEAGRGIASIDVVQKLLGAKRLNLRSAQAAIDGLSFDIESLPDHIRTLQTACHWRHRNATRTARSD